MIPSIGRQLRERKYKWSPKILSDFYMSPHKAPHLVATKSGDFGGISLIMLQIFICGKVTHPHIKATRTAKSKPLILRFFRIATKNSFLQVVAK